MKHLALCSMLLLVGSVCADDKKPDTTSDPYAELFSFPDKITLDAEQKEKLTDIRKTCEPSLTSYDKRLKTTGMSGADVQFIKSNREKLLRLINRKKTCLLTEEQRKSIGLKLFIPPCATEEALKDPKVWDLEQLEKDYTIEVRKFDPEEMVISFTVITKRKWTDSEKHTDTTNWNAATPQSPIKALFYDKNEETILQLTGPFMTNSRAAIMGGGVLRTPIKLTDKQAEEGLQRFRIKIDLDGYEKAAGLAVSAKLVCPAVK